MIKNANPVKLVNHIKEIKSLFIYCIGLQMNDFEVKGNSVFYKVDNFTFEFSLPLYVIATQVVNVGKKGEYIHHDIGCTSLSELCAVNMFTVYYQNEKICQINYSDIEKNTLEKVLDVYTNNPNVPKFEIKNDILFVPINLNSLIIKDNCAYIDESKVYINFFNVNDKVKFYFTINSKDNNLKNTKCVLNGVNANNNLKFDSILIDGTLSDFVLGYKSFGVSENKIAIAKEVSKNGGAFIANEINIDMKFKDGCTLNTDDIILLGFSEKDGSIVKYKVDKIKNYHTLKLNNVLDDEKEEDKKPDKDAIDKEL